MGFSVRCRKDVQVVLGLDNQAPARPDETRAGQGKVLRKRQLLDGAGKVGDAGNDERPLHDGRPKVHRLDADFTLPHALEPARLLLLLGLALLRAGAGLGALPPAVLEAEAHHLLLLLGRTGECLAGRRGKGGLAEHGPGGAEDGARRSHADREVSFFVCFRGFVGGEYDRAQGRGRGEEIDVRQERDGEGGFVVNVVAMNRFSRCLMKGSCLGADCLCRLGNCAGPCGIAVAEEGTGW